MTNYVNACLLVFLFACVGGDIMSCLIVMFIVVAIVECCCLAVVLMLCSLLLLGCCCLNALFVFRLFLSVHGPTFVFFDQVVFSALFCRKAQEQENTPT
jgi:energy-converting hydrogenase Eha subunit G